MKASTRRPSSPKTATEIHRFHQFVGRSRYLTLLLKQPLRSHLSIIGQPDDSVSRYDHSQSRMTQIETRQMHSPSAARQKKGPRPAATAAVAPKFFITVKTSALSKMQFSLRYSQRRRNSPSTKSERTWHSTVESAPKPLGTRSADMANRHFIECR